MDLDTESRQARDKWVAQLQCSEPRGRMVFSQRKRHPAQPFATDTAVEKTVQDPIESDSSIDSPRRFTR
jgi:hypothetical protein